MAPLGGDVWAETWRRKSDKVLAFLRAEGRLT